jgi:hypothetical protein
MSGIRKRVIEFDHKEKIICQGYHYNSADARRTIRGFSDSMDGCMFFQAEPRNFRMATEFDS